jgi:hypothetical protein
MVAYCVLGMSVLVAIASMSTVSRRVGQLSVASVATGVKVGVVTTAGPFLRAESRSVRCRRMPGEAFLERTAFLLASLGIMDRMVWEQQTVKENGLGNKKVELVLFLREKSH